MPLGGGTFTSMNKILPGAYINIVAAGSNAGAGVRGVATLPLAMNWGADGAVITLEAETFSRRALPLLGYAADAPELLLVREALKGAQTLLLWRINSGGDKAAATVGGIEWTAVCSGTRGNDLKGAVQQSIDDESKYDVITYLGQAEMDRQTVARATELVANSYVRFGEGTLAVEAAKPLTGGTNATVQGNAYQEYLAQMETETFNAIGYTGADATTVALFAAFARRINDEEGKKIQCVMADAARDDEIVTNVANGVKLADGTVIPKAQAVAWVCGMSAGADVNESLTNRVYEGAVDVDMRMSKTQYEEAIRAGQFVFYAENGVVRVVKDINSLVSFTAEKPADFASNRVMRVLNGWANDVADIFGAGYLGVQNNDDTGRQLLKADMVALGDNYQARGAIQDFDPEDIEIGQGDAKDEVWARNSLQPTDAMAKLYVTTWVI